MMKEKAENFTKELQDEICKALEQLDGKATFREDLWTREEGGGGRSRIISGGNVFEKGGVNFSAVYGPTPEKVLTGLQLSKADFFATGISLVLHPYNPWVPIVHMNLRYFEMSNGVRWFGGGIDLTPHFIVPEEAQFFHQQLKAACDKHSPEHYPKFKKWADDYFYIRHRDETRGVGGIFFDRLNGDDTEMEKIFAFVKEVGKTFIPAYGPLVSKNKEKSFTEREKEWQMVRRGRYVEFNLVYDKGTKFGLDTNGRIESILMSLPPVVKWEYDFQANEQEKKTLGLLKKDINWIDFAGKNN